MEWVTGNSSKYLYGAQYSAWLAVKKLFLISTPSIFPPYQTSLCALYTIISENLELLYMLIPVVSEFRNPFFCLYFMDEEQHIRKMGFL